MKTYADTLDEQAVAVEKCRAASRTSEYWRDHAAMIVVDMMREADSFFITKDFGHLVTAAANALPHNINPHPDDFPVPVGWITFEDPDAWSGHPFTMEPGSPDGRRVTVHGAFWAVIGNMYRFHEFSPDWPYPMVGPAGRLGEPTEWVSVKWMYAFNLLISQRNVAEIEDVQAPRAFRRRAERAGVRPTIRIIRLPRRVREHSSEQRAVDWQSRWIVSGHWRQQPWGPERKRIRPVWIAPYLKGPEDKPLVAPAHRLFVADAPR